MNLLKDDQALPEVISDVIGEYISFDILYGDRKEFNQQEFKDMSKKLPKRICKEFQRIQKNAGQDGIYFIIHPNNYRYILIEIPGPKDSPYDNGLFYVEMFLGKQYPMKKPKIRMITPIYHPNIDKIGRMSISGLLSWTPALTIQRVATQIFLTLEDPNPDDPLNNEIAELWKTNLKLAHKNAKEWTVKYAQLGLDT